MLPLLLHFTAAVPRSRAARARVISSAICGMCHDPMAPPPHSPSRLSITNGDAAEKGFYPSLPPSLPPFVQQLRNYEIQPSCLPSFLRRFNFTGRGERRKGRCDDVFFAAFHSRSGKKGTIFAGFITSFLAWLPMNKCDEGYS